MTMAQDVPTAPITVRGVLARLGIDLSKRQSLAAEIQAMAQKANSECETQLALARRRAEASLTEAELVAFEGRQRRLRAAGLSAREELIAHETERILLTEMGALPPREPDLPKDPDPG